MLWFRLNDVDTTAFERSVYTWLPSPLRRKRLFELQSWLGDIQQIWTGPIEVFKTHAEGTRKGKQR